MKTRSLAAALGVAATASIAALAAPGVADAAVLLTDNFDSGTPATSWSGDGTFISRSVGGAATDLVANSGPSGFCAPGASNQCVDLDGVASEGVDPSGKLVTADLFGPGVYTLTFDLAGNQLGGAPQTTKIKFGGWKDEITLASDAPWTTYTFTIDATGTSRLKFKEQGASDQEGNFLDNVSLSSGPSADTFTSAVPEPATWTMLLLGVGAVGASARRTRRLRVRVLA